MGIAPEANIDVPQGEPVLNGLLQVAVPPAAIPDRWESGFVLKAPSCGGSFAWNPCTPHNDEIFDRTKPSQEDDPDEVVYQPFEVISTITCSSFGFEAANYVENVRRLHEASVGSAIEREFLLGEAIHSNPHLNSLAFDDDHVLNPSGVGPGGVVTGVSPRDALILLSNALAGCLNDERGFIHASPGLVTAWWALGDVTPNDDGKLITASRGDYVIAGSGYDGSAPHGAAPVLEGQEWAYATGPVHVLISEPTVIPETLAEALDRSTNTVEFRAESVAAVYHDGCCQFGVLVDVYDSGVCCDPTEESADGTATGFWIEDGSESPYGVPGNILVLDFGDGSGGDFTPPFGSVDVVTSVAVGQAITGSPVVSDVPTSGWSAMSEFTAPPFIILAPVDFVPPALAGVPAWLKMEWTSAEECDYEIIVYLPVGIPGSWEDDVPFYFSSDRGITWTLVTVEGGSEEPASEDYEITGACHPPVCATPVMIPECFQPIGVTGDLTVTPADPEILSYRGGQWEGVAVDSVEDKAVAAGAKMIIFSLEPAAWWDGSLESGTYIDIVEMAGAAVITGLSVPPSRQLVAPAGSLFPALTLRLVNGSGAGGTQWGGFVALY